MAFVNLRFVQGGSSPDSYRGRMKFSANNPRHRKPPKRYFVLVRKQPRALPQHLKIDLVKQPFTFVNINAASCSYFSFQKTTYEFVI